MPPPLFTRRLVIRPLATADASAVLVWGFDGLPLKRIVAVAYPRNLASLNVIARLDVALEGVQFCYGATLAKYGPPIDDWRAAARGAAL